ncbi:hypothetical protein [Streptomyces platensis]|uniref:hypothetical protein n=1 Tax=Streptomyces platensis TaxID=58346 RepID=UPI003331673D
MDDGVVALLGALVGAVGTGGAAYVTARLARRQSQEQLAAQRVQFEKQIDEQRRQFEAQAAEQYRQFEWQAAEQHRQFEAQSRADHIRSRRDYRADAYKKFLTYATAIKTVVVANRRQPLIIDHDLFVQTARGMEAALHDVQIEGPLTVSRHAATMVEIANSAIRTFAAVPPPHLEMGEVSAFRLALDSFTQNCSRALNDESLPDMDPRERGPRLGHMARRPSEY